jgi:hypothetical protein
MLHNHKPLEREQWRVILLEVRGYFGWISDENPVGSGAAVNTLEILMSAFVLEVKGCWRRYRPAL